MGIERKKPEKKEEKEKERKKEKVNNTKWMMIFFSVEKFVEVKTLPPRALGLSGSPPRLARIG